MAKTTPEQNKALVLEAFDTLFNKRDYTAAARFWSDRYMQHSAHIAPGRASFLCDIATFSAEGLRRPSPRDRAALMGSPEAEEAMPRDQFIAEIIAMPRHGCRRNPGGTRKGLQV
jgi:hypothetical protein